ncbi:MAG: biotin carboxylase N-terminal domain-containing protein [Pseudomonadota bacterium]
MFSKLLIANRGEIACRVMRTARAMGIKTVAVYSDADAHAMHVRMADEAYRLGPPAASESYLLSDKIIEIAKECGAEAIHPGYGFLSENASFSQACADAGIAFVGPKPHTIEAMGSKARAKQLMGEAGVPMLPGYQGEDQSLATFKAEAERIGYPVLLKAAAGGGGKGMRIVERAEDLEGEFESAKREAMSAFGDDRFIAEKFLGAPRHVEVQVFGDSHGNVVHLFERDCSVQRRYQKVVEEAPAPNLPDDVRASLHQAAVDAARKVDYVGAGTVEFLYDGADGVYFMEMNTRLQVEHPVTEEITGVDLVEWQLLVASGEPIPLSQDDITADGHAVEVRLYAEDPSENYLPQVGRLTGFDIDEPARDFSQGIVRVDTGVEAGDAITPFYDPMIAKVIAFAETRTDAIATLSDSLAEGQISGLVTNRDFLVDILRHEDFVSAPPATTFLKVTGLEDKRQALEPLHAAAAVMVIAGIIDGERLGFRLNAPDVAQAFLDQGGEAVTARLTFDGHAWTAELDGEASPLSLADGGEDGLIMAMGDATLVLEDGWVEESGSAAILQTATGSYRVPIFDSFAAAGQGDAAEQALSSPMPATVTGVMVAVGDTVVAGDTLMTLEAMKMETVIKAPHDGAIDAIHFSKGDSVSKGALLLGLAAAS